MGKWIGIVERLSTLGGVFSSACVIAITVLILGETLARAAVGRSIFIAEEYSAYLMANFVMLGLAYTLKMRGHIRVNLLLSRLAGRPRAVLEAAACGVGFLIFAMATYFLGLLVADSFSTGEESMNVTKTKVYLPQIGLLLGSFLMTLQMAAEAARQVIFLVERQPGPGEGT
jgi:TRAP-type mannitol/chloroaromatic compound transport system permease small subunit